MGNKYELMLVEQSERYRSDKMRLVEYPVKDFESYKRFKDAFPVWRFWHNGIHFQELIQYKIYDGEIVAVRISETYENSFIYKDIRYYL